MRELRSVAASYDTQAFIPAQRHRGGGRTPPQRERPAEPRHERPRGRRRPAPVRRARKGRRVRRLPAVVAAARARRRPAAPSAPRCSWRRVAAPGCGRRTARSVHAAAFSAVAALDLRAPRRRRGDGRRHAAVHVRRASAVLRPAGCWPPRSTRPTARCCGRQRLDGDGACAEAPVRPSGGLLQRRITDGRPAEGPGPRLGRDALERTSPRYGGRVTHVGGMRPADRRRRHGHRRGRAPRARRSGATRSRGWRSRTSPSYGDGRSRTGRRTPDRRRGRDPGRPRWTRRPATCGWHAARTGDLDPRRPRTAASSC